MSKRSVIRCLLSLLMMLYLVIALRYTSHAAAADTYKDLRIIVNDTANRGFVTSQDIDMELGMLGLGIRGMRRDSIDTRALEHRLMAMDKIERANCTVLNDGTLRIEVSPLEPVARIFDENGTDYYVNRSGKRMSGGPRYHVDVPVATGRFADRGIDPTCIFPILDYISGDDQLSSFISSVQVNSATDINLIPAVSGQVICFGDTSDIDNKFRRLYTFYQDVMPVKGWELYDTISVKWRGQIVANRRKERPRSAQITTEEYIDIDSNSTMSTGMDDSSTGMDDSQAYNPG